MSSTEQIVKVQTNTQTDSLLTDQTAFSLLYVCLKDTIFCLFASESPPLDYEYVNGSSFLVCWSQSPCDA